jgi:hypothetical protein
MSWLPDSEQHPDETPEAEQTRLAGRYAYDGPDTHYQCHSCGGYGYGLDGLACVRCKGTGERKQR